MHFPHNDAFVVTVHISCCNVSKILGDRGSSVNILYDHALDRMDDTPSWTKNWSSPNPVTSL